ncbi:MAG: hypothetical protein FWH42_01255 [Dehalococcoidia bacterium]|nr:hypothetical protein [Dehalococcoidia bacterium]
MGELGFSYIGLCYMLMLIVPNTLWAYRKPEGYDSSIENKAFLLIERVGQVLCTVTVLFFSDYNPHAMEWWITWLLVSVSLMVIYEFYWLRYFRSKKTVNDFYRSYCGFPVPGALLPVLAFLFLGIYGKVIWLILASIILGVGHIGIHMQHIKNLKRRGLA